MATLRRHRSTIALALVAALSGLLVTAIFSATRARVALQRQSGAERQLLELIPALKHDDMRLIETRVDDVPLLGLRAPQPAYIARRAGAAVAAILPATARDGYGGDIDLLIGIDRNGNVTGVRVLHHRETAGLGARIDADQSTWLHGFVGKSLGNPREEQWRVKRDLGAFDQFTGATVTPRAVTASIKRVLQYFAAHRATLLAMPVAEERSAAENRPAAENSDE